MGQSASSLMFQDAQRFLQVRLLACEAHDAALLEVINCSALDSEWPDGAFISPPGHRQPAIDLAPTVRSEFIATFNDIPFYANDIGLNYEGRISVFTRIEIIRNCEAIRAQECSPIVRNHCVRTWLGYVECHGFGIHSGLNGQILECVSRCDRIISACSDG